MVLETDLVAVEDRDFDVISGTLTVNNHTAFHCRFEFEINVPAVTHVERGQTDRRVRYAECHHVVEEICNETKRILIGLSVFWITELKVTVDFLVLLICLERVEYVQDYYAIDTIVSF